MIDDEILQNSPNQRKFISQQILSTLVYYIPFFFFYLCDSLKIIFLFFFSVNVAELDLAIEKASRPDVIFIRKHGPEIYLALYESLELSSNTVENVESIYTTLALLAIELASEETVLELLRLVLSLQDLALTSAQISLSLKFNLHAIVISLLVLISYVCNITALMEYAKKVSSFELSTIYFILKYNNNLFYIKVMT